MATRWGIISAGKISHDFVSALRSVEPGEHEIVAVATRNVDSARTFANLHKIPKTYGSYEELASDPDVEVAYVGTINSNHFAVGKMMLEAGKHVLMEKPMTLNAKQTRQLVDIAKKNRRFLMEAIWSRFFPAYKFLTQSLQSGAIGDVVHVNVNFGIPIAHIDRLSKKELGGGTILDIGIYALNVVAVAYGGEMPLKIASVGHLNEDGVDIGTCTGLLFSGNRSATVTTSALAEMTCDAVITGTKGRIRLPKPMWCPTTLETPDKTYEFPLPDTVVPCNFTNSSGLRFEAMEVRECIKKGLLESPILPLEESITLAEIMDEIRRQIGSVFPED